MKILVDTNVVLRSIETAHPHCAIADAALTSLRSGGHELILVPQVIYESWVVTTRPLAENGLGFSTARASAELARLLELYSLHHDDLGVFLAWRDLVERYSITGKPAHDVRLVAAMIRHDVSHMLTFNSQHFSRFTEIEILAPDAAERFPSA